MVESEDWKDSGAGSIDRSVASIGVSGSRREW